MDIENSHELVHHGSVSEEEIKVRNTVLKVVEKPAYKKRTVGINLQGEWMKEFGFELGNFLELIATENTIVISKVLDA